MTRTRMTWRTASARIVRRVVIVDALVVLLAAGGKIGFAIARASRAGELGGAHWPAWALVALWCPLIFLAWLLLGTGVLRALDAVRRALRRASPEETEETKKAPRPAGTLPERTPDEIRTKSGGQR